MSETFTVTITYLEQRERPQTPLPAKPPLKTALMRAQTPPVHFYRYLYDQVGGPWHWVSRRYMEDDELSSIINDPQVYLYVLYCDGVPCGMGEIDRRAGHQPSMTAEIKFFGLMEDFMGKGLGRWFFASIVDLAWSLGPERVIIETCTGDHPAALPLYQKMGFTVYGQGEGTINWRG